MAAISAVIANNVYNPNNYNPHFVRDSNGYFYTIYCDQTTLKLYVARSIDGGANWTSEQIGAGTNHYFCSIAIDDQDNLHILYSKGSTGGSAGTGYFYRKGVYGNWENEETVLDTSAYTSSNNHSYCGICIDNNNYVHTACCAQNANVYGLYYRVKAAAWGASASAAPFSSYPANNLRMLVDIDGRVWTFFGNGNTYGGATKYFTYYDETLNAISSISNYFGNSGGIATDSAGNIYVVENGSSTTSIFFQKYTKSTGLWGAAVDLDAAATFSSGRAHSISVDSSGKIVVTKAGANLEYSYSTDGGATWSAAATFLAGTYSDFAAGLSLMFPLVGTSRPNFISAGFAIVHLDESNDILHFYASDGVTFDALSTANHSRGAETSLPSDDANLTRYTASDYTNIAADDGVTTDQTAANKYAIHLFKNKGSSVEDSIAVAWTGQTDVAPSSSTVYLQIFNRTSGEWETLSSDAATAANTNFTLVGLVTANLEDYYDANLWVSCRIYQHS